jgi:D-glycero-D-manno-heptose 1,7-bisphosphate phosphatase
MSGRRAVFLDRDGVINRDTGYTHRIDDFVFMDGIFDFARKCRQLNFELVVVTNQAGIARGYYTEQDFHTLTAWVESRFREEGAPLTATYYCPYHPDGIAPYRQQSSMRKPNPGMLYAAAQEHAIDLGSSIIVGDQETDAMAGHTAGLAGIVLFGRSVLPEGSAAQVAISNHSALIKWIDAFGPSQAAHMAGSDGKARGN